MMDLWMRAALATLRWRHYALAEVDLPIDNGGDGAEVFGQELRREKNRLRDALKRVGVS